MSAPIVVNPNREGRFLLQTDALTGTESAAGGMGAVLLQEQKDKTERVVAYAIEVSRSPYNSAVFCVAKKQLPNAAPGDPVPLRVGLNF
jgi:hypothetical protein